MNCILCARRDRTTEIDHGHVCPGCLQRISSNLTDLLALALLATVEPRNGAGSGRTVPGSKPPINVDGIDPALALVDVGCGPTALLEILESWERLVREARGMSPYGPASAARMEHLELDPHEHPHPTTITLTGVVGFLRASLPWWATSPDQPIDDFADEVRLCHRALARWNPDRGPKSWRVPCPTMTTSGADCGYLIPVTRVASDERVDCPRCGRIWETDRLLAVAGRDADVWVDIEAAVAATGIPEGAIRRWARSGLVRRLHGQYAIVDIRNATAKGLAQKAAYASLAQRVAPLAT